ncbi:hypothetical protein ABZ379_01640 [Streptomyces canus]
MGADAPGKREFPPELFARARVFCDLPEQAPQALGLALLKKMDISP